MKLNASLGTGLAAAGCSGCGNVFTTVRNFDSHQRFTKDGLVCLDPSAVGLERKPSGRWGMPTTTAGIVQFATAVSESDQNGSGLVSSDTLTNVA